MADPEKVELTPDDISLSDKGEIIIKNPVVAEKLKGSLSNLADLKAVAGQANDNYVGCGGNVYQCGKKLDDLQSVMDQLSSTAQNLRQQKQ